MAAVAAWLRLIRAPAVVMAVLLTLLGAHLAGPGGDPFALAMAALAVASATAGGNALNDVHDWEIDRINRADRPIPSGAIGRPAARRLAWAAFTLAVACAGLASPWCFAVCLVNCGLLVGYARHSKSLGLAKGVLVAYLVGSATLFGILDPFRVPGTALVLALCAALATLGREILKDIEDLAGDRAIGARTLPIAIGPPASRWIAGLALVLAVALSFLPWWLAATPVPPSALATLLAGGLVLVTASGVVDAGRAQRLVMLGSAIEMVAFAQIGA